MVRAARQIQPAGSNRMCDRAGFSDVRSNSEEYHVSRQSKLWKPRYRTHRVLVKRRRTLRCWLSITLWQENAYDGIIADMLLSTTGAAVFCDHTTWRSIHAAVTSGLIVPGHGYNSVASLCSSGKTLAVTLPRPHYNKPAVQVQSKQPC